MYVKRTNERTSIQTQTHIHYIETLKLNHIYTFDGKRNHTDKLIHFSESKCAIDIGK